MQKKIKIRILGITSFILLLLFFSVIFSILNMKNEKIIKGVKIGNIEVSGLDSEEARKKIKEIIEKDILLQYGSYEENLTIEEIGVKADIETAIQKATQIAKTGNIIKDNYQILYSFLFGTELNMQTSIENTKLEQKIQEIEGKLPGSYVESSYYVEENDLIIKKGKEGLKINKEEFEEILKKTFTNTEKIIGIPTQNKGLEKINLEKIYQEIYREPQNAYIVQTPKVQIHPEVNGIKFAISMEEAETLIMQEQEEEYRIPLKVTIPEITLEKLGKEAFPEKIAEYTTRYDASNKNRSNNLELASKKIDGTIIMPGEIFSYNKTVGERTIAAGYKEATVYYDGKVVDGIGGGICQLSSTLYNVAVYANLDIVARSNHRFLTSYVPAGRDATVSWGTIDFKFKNTRLYPIKITSTVKNGLVTVQIYGIKEEEYEIEIESRVIEEIPYTIHYVEDNTLLVGEEKIKQYGNKGAKTVVYKILKKSGIEVSREILSKDTYSALERIILKGTRKQKEIVE